MSLSVFKVNQRGSGSAQYPPRMMLALLIYCYANGIFSSRRIERATHRDIAVRYLTDEDSRLMRKSKRSGYEQAYNAQAVVDAEGSQLILGARVSQCASDSRELSADVASIPAELGRPSSVLADSGYASARTR